MPHSSYPEIFFIFLHALQVAGMPGYAGLENLPLNK